MVGKFLRQGFLEILLFLIKYVVMTRMYVHM